MRFLRTSISGNVGQGVRRMRRAGSRARIDGFSCRGIFLGNDVSNLRLCARAAA
jgi:hypothetical protein